LIAVVIGFVAAANLLSVMLTSSRESARTIGVQQTLGLTPRQLVGHGAVAAASIGIVGSAVGLPLGLLVYRMMSDSVTSLIGAGPGFGRYPSIILLVSFGVTAVALAALLGALATRRLAMKPPAELVRWE
jgi:putative ABC transport system permease protein